MGVLEVWGVVFFEVEDIFLVEGDYFVWVVFDEVVVDCFNVNSFGYFIFFFIVQVWVFLFDKFFCFLDGFVEDFIDGEVDLCFFFFGE